MALYHRSIVWRLACDPVARLWSGIGDIQLPANRLDARPQIYKGAGALLSVPSLKQLINGIAERVDFTVSGVTPETIRLALEDRDTIKGASLHVGYVEFDSDLQIANGPIWDWHGVADILSTDRQPAEIGGQRTISLSVAASDTDRANPSLAWWTDADQRKRSPTDRAFDRVAGINAGSTRRFGPK